MFGPIQGKRRQGGQKRQWFDDVTQWIGKDLPTCYRLAEGREIRLDTSFIESLMYVLTSRVQKIHPILFFTVCFKRCCIANHTPRICQKLSTLFWILEPFF